jgi:hypothetical protein
VDDVLDTIVDILTEPKPAVEIFLLQGTKVVGKFVDGRFVQTGNIDREAAAFACFKMLNALTRPKLVNVGGDVEPPENVDGGTP